jgi:opacity protein-like surface antigen
LASQDADKVHSIDRKPLEQRSLRPLRYALDRSLFYGKAGAALAGSAITKRRMTLPSTPVLTQHELESTRVGFLLGAGWEYASAPNWSAKIEYNYINYASDTIPYAANNPLGLVKTKTPSTS